MKGSNRRFALTAVLFISTAIISSRGQCESWGSRHRQNHVEGASNKIPSCAKPVSLLHEGQFSSGIGNTSSNADSLTRQRSLLPHWFNATSFRLGQSFAAKHITGMVIGTTYALSIFSGVPDVSSVVFHTNQANTPAKANCRHLANMLHFKLWLEDSLADTEKLSPRLVKSLTKVREIYSKAAARFKHKLPVNVPRSTNVTHAYTHKLDKRLWAALATDLRNSNIPAQHRSFPKEMRLGPESHDVVAINHLGMSLIQWALIGPQFLVPEACGVWGTTDEEWRHYFHFWAVLGYALGMDDEYNLALQPDLATARVYFQEIYDKYFVPSIFHFENDEKGQILWECFFEGPLNLFLGPSAPFYFRKDQVLIFVLETFLGVPATALRAKPNSDGGGHHRLPLSTGFERLLPLYQFESVRKLGVWSINNLFLRPDAKQVFGIDSNDLEQVVEYAYT